MRDAVKNFFKNADILLFALCIISTLYGLIIISSATHSMDESRRFLIVQAGSAFVGIVAYIAISHVDLEHISALWRLILIFNVLFLLTLIPFGVVDDTGNKSWLRFAGIGVQPAEVVKVTFILLLAKQMHYLRDKINKISSIALLLGHLLLMLGLIVGISHDAGVGLIYIFIFIFMTIISGIKLRWFAILGAAFAGSLPLLWRFLREDQKMRFLVVIDPNIDPLGYGFHANQSKIALGSGQLFGQGLYNGTQTQHNRLPAKHTDFIFSVAGEELGLIGCVLIICLLTAIILRCLYVAAKANSSMSSLICFGVAGMFIFQVVENIGMCLGLTPIIGITLPFFSYGGSSVITMFCAMGMISSVKMRPKPEWLRNKY